MVERVERVYLALFVTYYHFYDLRCVTAYNLVFQFW